MNEIWKDIDGYDGQYQVSNLGRVKSTSLINGCGTFKRDLIISQTDNGHGYLIVQLHKEGKRRPRYVHRLVAEAFCEKRDGCFCVNHLDYNKKNNLWTNLEWCTTKENVQYSAERMKHPKNGTKAKTGEKGIYKRRGKYRVVVNGKEYKPQNTIEEAVALRDAILLAEGA